MPCIMCVLPVYFHIDLVWIACLRSHHSDVKRTFRGRCTVRLPPRDGMNRECLQLGRQQSIKAVQNQLKFLMCAITSTAESRNLRKHRCTMVVALAHLQDMRYEAGRVDAMFLGFGNIAKRATR
jgi:hypothetical protein